jgi:tetratricopeptide (TPR) repeat protein
MDIDAFWEYSDPTASEARFRGALDATTGDTRLELLTQIARTYSLRRRFAEAHALLDEVEPQLPGAGIRPRLRYLLERGRTFNSAGAVMPARELFVQAWTEGVAHHEEGLAVDAAHMVAITFGNAAEALTWNQQGIALARQSRDPKARALLPAMLNNTAWALHDAGQYTDALTAFQAAEAAWTATNKSRPIQIAKWSVARCLRSLGRHQEALDILNGLEAEYAAQQIVDGYLDEEIAENFLALDQAAAAKPYFQRAAATLAQDEWFVQQETARLARLQQIAVA